MVQWLSLASVLLTVMQTVASAAGCVCLTQTLPLTSRYFHKLLTLRFRSLYSAIVARRIQF